MENLHNSVKQYFPNDQSMMLKVVSDPTLQPIFKILPLDRDKDTDIENGLEDTGRGKGKLG